MLVVINHFDKFLLFSQKFADYQLFKQALIDIQQKRHLTLHGFIEILAIRASMNRGLSALLQSAFPDVIPVPRPRVKIPKIIDPL